MPRLPDPKRRLRLALRRKVKAMRRFSVEDLGEGRVRLTCRTCGDVTEQIAGAESKSVRTGASKAPEAGSWAAKHLARWWADSNRNAGISGECKKCTQIERDKQYPLK